MAIKGHRAGGKERLRRPSLTGIALPSIQFNGASAHRGGSSRGAGFTALMYGGSDGHKLERGEVAGLGEAVAILDAPSGL